MKKAILLVTILLVATFSFSYWSQSMSIGYDFEGFYSASTSGKYTFSNTLGAGGLLQVSTDKEFKLVRSRVGLLFDKTFYIGKIDIAPTVNAGITVHPTDWNYWVFTGVRAGYSFGAYSVFAEGGYSLDILKEERSWEGSWVLSVGGTVKPAFQGL